MGLSTTSVSAITDRLEAKGVVVLERQPDDPCAALVRISPTHEQDRRARWISREQKIDEFVQNLSEEEVETFCTVLDKYSAFMHEGS
jgi:DNA-binding MarR family transcriptional regulator